MTTFPGISQAIKEDDQCGGEIISRITVARGNQKKIVLLCNIQQYELLKSIKGMSGWHHYVALKYKLL